MNPKTDYSDAVFVLALAIAYLLWAWAEAGFPGLRK